MTTPDELPVSARLRPGLVAVRREPGRLQVGIDPPLRVLLPDVPEVRDILTALGAGEQPRPRTRIGRRAVADLLAAGAVVDVSAEAARAAARAAGRVGLRVDADCPRDTVTAIKALLTAVGCSTPSLRAGRGDSDVVLIASGSPMSRERVDELVRDRVPHLLVGAVPDGVDVGPFSLAGTTACVRCSDARLAEADARRAVVWEQLARAATGPSIDPALWSMALAWGARDVATFLEGGRPITWSATARLTTTAPPRVTTWLRHPYCGCSWAEGLVG